MKKWKNTFPMLFLLLGIMLAFVLYKVPNLKIEDEQSELLPVQQNILANIKFQGDEKTYQLDLSKWGVFNDGTHPKETTKGFNEALKWAQREGYTTFYVPAGTYLVSKGLSDSDPEARINMVSNMTFLLDDKAVIQKETNGYEIYSTLFLDSEVENVTIKGGTLRGDRDTHDYSQQGEATEGTHEWGNGIDTAGAKNIVVDSVKIERFTGDGIEIGGEVIYGGYITGDDLEIGGINDNGELIEQNGKIRSNNYDVQNFNNPIYKNPHYRNVMMWIPDGVDGNYDIFFYEKDGSFIKAERDLHFNSTWGYSLIPDDVDFFRVVFNSHSTKGVEVNRMTVAITTNMTIKNCDIGNNRRQGITVGASDDIKIIDNEIHHTHGIAPESGIDIEPGFFPAINTLIKGNQFLNNKIHMVFAYGGNAIVEENYFGPNVGGGVGFSINPEYHGATVRKNKFESSNFVTWGNTEFLNNTLQLSSAVFDGGSDVNIDGIEGVDSSLSFTQTESDGIKVSNVTLTSSGQDIQGGIAVYGKPLKMKDITLQGNNYFSGDGNSDSEYHHINFINTPEISLALGKYNDCSAIAAEFALNIPGKISLEKCKFINTTLYTYNEKTEATIQQSTFENDQDHIGQVVLALEAKNVKVLGNTFNIVTSKNTEYPIIQIGRDASENDPTKVFGASIKGNIISTNITRNGIDTSNGGIGAPSYEIENNILSNSYVNLKNNDINFNNKIVNKK
ncbi:right-handed parallel beta-helix repeat-containing protein [Lederbergia citrea]|uniref:right-handed parallel beta-helix repeat-containing protein n=1 Tax=Lederbergia citrea TaxID=2833581 RepID=UPI001BC91BF0|nr:right-handed parallel beta-helix repeat-containing protein [Lederbergia citrea]MBS4179134.1 right-handed parallel beta-helix repeat-containing protein [Lederbergia citrea]